MNQTDTPTITILGTGYVGLTTAALFAAAGMKTYVVDPNQSRLDAVREGRSFFFEEGLDPLVAHTVKNGTLIPTSSYAESIPRSQIVFSAVGTPDNPDGSSNLTYLFAAAEEAAAHLQPSSIYVQKSTVPVGTGAKVKQLFAKKGINATYASNPEFLRESTALLDSLWFDRIVVGGDDEMAIERVMAVYRHVRQNREAIAAIAGLVAPEETATEQYIATNLESAELIKVSANAFLALKISFANSIAKLADQTGADINEVMNAVGADARIGRAFLNAGRGYGGGCFPKDVSGLISSAQEHGIDLQIMKAAQAVNEAMPTYIISKIKALLHTNLADKKITVLGLAFKAGTSDARRSAGVRLANLLVEAGADVHAYDPKAIDEAKRELHHAVKIHEDLRQSTSAADVVLVATKWEEFLRLDLKELASQMRSKGFVDCENAFARQAVESAGLTYIGIGR